MEVKIRLFILSLPLSLSDCVIRLTKQDASQLLWPCLPSTSLVVLTDGTSVSWLLWWKKGQVSEMLLGSLRKEKGKELSQSQTYSEESRPTLIAVWKGLCSQFTVKGKCQIPSAIHSLFLQKFGEEELVWIFGQKYIQLPTSSGTILSGILC